MDADTIKAIVAIVVAAGGAIAGVIRWGVVRITKAIDDSSAAHTAAAREAATAQLSAAEKYAMASQNQAVAFAQLQGDIRAVTEYIHQHSEVRASGSGGRQFTSDR